MWPSVSQPHRCCYGVISSGKRTLPMTSTSPWTGVLFAAEKSFVQESADRPRFLWEWHHRVAYVENLRVLPSWFGSVSRPFLRVGKVSEPLVQARGNSKKPITLALSRESSKRTGKNKQKQNWRAYRCLLQL